MAVTTSRLPNRETFLEWKEFCLVIQKLTRTCLGWKRPLLDDHYPQLCALILQQNENGTVCTQVRHIGNTTVSKVLRDTLYNYARDNLALVNIYIKQPVVTKILRDQRVPLIWFVANCGGILGLCMGFSIVTVFEVFHCLFKFLIAKLLSCSCCDKLCPKLGHRRPQNGTRDPITVNGNYSLNPCVRNEANIEAGHNRETNEDEISTGLLHHNKVNS